MTKGGEAPNSWWSAGGGESCIPGSNADSGIVSLLARAFPLARVSATARNTDRNATAMEVIAAVVTRTGIAVIAERAMSRDRKHLIAYDARGATPATTDG